MGLLTDLAFVNGATLPPEMTGTQTIATELVGLQDRQLDLWDSDLNFGQA